MSDEKKEAAEPAAAKAKSPILLFAIVGVVCIGLGVGAAMFLLPKGDSTTEEASVKTTSEHEEKKPAKKPEKKKEEKKDAHGGSGEETASAETVYTVKDIIVNPAATGGSRFLSASVSFELGDSDAVSTFKSREPLIRDALITILASKTVGQLTDAREKEIIRVQIRKRVMQLMEMEELAGVYFTDFVLQ